MVVARGVAGMVVGSGGSGANGSRAGSGGGRILRGVRGGVVEEAVTGVDLTLDSVVAVIVEGRIKGKDGARTDGGTGGFFRC